MSVGRVLTLGLGTPFSSVGYLVTLGLGTSAEIPVTPYTKYIDLATGNILLLLPLSAAVDTTIWGSITGALSDQTDLQAALDSKAAALGVDDNYVTDAEKIVLGNTSGVNTGDNTNAATLLGNTWASPAAIGSVTPAAGTFTTLTVSLGASVFGSTSYASSGIPVSIYKDILTEGTGPTVRIKGYSPSYELMDKDGIQNYYIGIDDNDSNAFHLGTGYGPGQGITPFFKWLSGASTITGVLTVTGTITGNNLSGTNTGDNPGVTSVGATAPVASTGGTTPTVSMVAASAGVNGYMTGTYASKLDGIAAGATNNGTVTGSGTTSGTNTGDQTNISGNAGTVSNGVYTTGSYANPAWITSLAGSKITPGSGLVCRCWVRFNSAGTVISSAGGTFSVSHTATGKWTITLPSGVMSSGNYAYSFGNSDSVTSSYYSVCCQERASASPTSTTFKMLMFAPGIGLVDPAESICVFFYE